MFEAVSLKADADPSLVPEIIRVEYDLWMLRITCIFAGKREPTYVEFRKADGFRVLDEGQLSAFWQKETRAKGWLWELRSGGWLAHEGKRDDFLLGHVRGVREFLVLGVNDCVNVIAFEEPHVVTAEP